MQVQYLKQQQEWAVTQPSWTLNALLRDTENKNGGDFLQQ